MSDKADPWRFRCPKAHANLVGLGTGQDYRCMTCGRAYDGEPMDVKRPDELEEVDGDE